MAQEHIDEAVDWSIANGSLIYFILRLGAFTAQCRGGEVKVGTTRNLAKRFSELQTGSPDTYLIFGTMPGNKVVERILHKKWKPYHIRGEWFTFSDEIRQFAVDHRGGLDESPGCCCPKCKRQRR